VCASVPSKLNNVSYLFFQAACFFFRRSSPRAISTGQLHTLLRFHLLPINQVVFLGPYSMKDERSHLACAGVFFRVSRARNRTGQCAAAHKKQSSGLFFSPREIPACVTRNTPAYAGVFFRVSVRGIEPDGAQVLLCAIMERCVFGCILDMKIPPELSEFFLCLL